MPIDIDEFEDAHPEDLHETPAKQDEDQVFEYLAFNPRKAYSRNDIQSATGIRTIDLVGILSRLEREGLIRHKGTYWAVDPDFERQPAEVRAEDRSG